jgi:hypothetical protein
MLSSLNPQNRTTGNPQGLLPMTPDQTKAVLMSTIDERPRTRLDPTNPSDKARIDAFNALPASAKYDVTKARTEDDTRSAGVLKDGTIVVRETGYGGFPIYSTAGKFIAES